jgi:signal transduction histidine kinase/ActR/RegA family two-component response regulator
MDDPRKEIEVLQATIAVLEQENSQLSERAEDAMLLGLVAEAIEGLKTPLDILANVLERASILKNYPFVTCGKLVNSAVKHICSYCAFSDDENIGYPITIDPEISDELEAGPFVSNSMDGIVTNLSTQGFTATSVTIIPFHCHYYPEGIFLFFDRETSQNHNTSGLFLLDQIVNMAAARLNNLYLTEQLDTLNTSLEERIREKTAALRSANEQLQEAHKRFEAVLDGIDAHIYVVDMETYDLLYINRKSANSLPCITTGTPCYKYLRNEQFPCPKCKIPEFLSSPLPSDKVIVWEFWDPAINKWILNRETVVSWPNVHRAKLTISTDISEIKKAEAEREEMQKSLQHAQKMEAVGVLAGSVAHDLNNILSGVVSYPDLLLANLAADSEMRKPLETIQAAGRKSAAIVRDLLTLARRGLNIEESVDLGNIVKEYVESAECETLLRNHSNVTVVSPAEPGFFPVLGSAVHLSNVLMNIVTNGIEAMPDGGTITISLGVISMMSHPQGWPIWRAGDYVELTIADTGTGIPEHMMRKIFDPFFTGKILGRSGTGLGLAIVWGTVIDHNGAVHVESTEGKGTSFHIFLPLQGGDKVRPTVVKSREPVIGNGESILVVDDIENQRQIALEMLQYLNYTVSTAESGEAAIEYLRKNKADLVLLDMIMPNGIDGLETYKRILAILPNQKVIIVSGYSQKERIDEAERLGISQYVSKPYTLRNISEAIQKALAKNEP